MDADELRLLEDTLADITAKADGTDLTAALDDFGWLEILRDEPQVAVRSVFTAQGRAGSWSAALHDVLAADIGSLDPGLSGAVTVVLPAPRAFIPGRDDLIDGVVVGTRSARWIVAPVLDADDRLTVRRFAADDVRMRPSGGLDPQLAVARVSGTAAGGDIVIQGADAVSWWRSVETTGRQALCHQVCGAASQMLHLALEHAMERAQFGARIGTFQAVRHKLAEAHVALTAASAAVEASWTADDRWLAATTAKLVTSRSATTIMAHAQQVLAGIGFTAEHPFHTFMKRAVVLDRLFGNASDLAPVVGGELVRRGAAPRLVEL
jgi:hypothetical protein